MTDLDKLRVALFLPVGIALMIGSAFAATATQDYLRSSLVVPGEVIAELYGPHHVQVRFRTLQGRTIAYTQGGDVTLHKGERVPVRYNPADPRLDPCVDRWGALWGTTVSLMLMGLVFSIISISLLIMGRGNGNERKVPE